MTARKNKRINPALAIALSVTASAVSFSAEAQSRPAQPYIPPVRCPAEYIATTVERGCIPDRSADFEMGRGKYARPLTLPATGISTAAPHHSTTVGDTNMTSNPIRK